MVLFILQHIKILFIEQSSIVRLVIDQLAATYAPSNAFDPFSLSFRQKINTSQYLSLYNKQYYLRKLNAYGSKINICQAASWSFNMQLIVYRGFSSTPNRMPHSLLIFLYKRGALIIDHAQVWYEGWSPWTKRIFLLFNHVHVV